MLAITFLIGYIRRQSRNEKRTSSRIRRLGHSSWLCDVLAVKLGKVFCFRGLICKTSVLFKNLIFCESYFHEGTLICGWNHPLSHKSTSKSSCTMYKPSRPFTHLGSRVTQLTLELRLHRLLVVWPQADFFSTWCISVLSYRRRIIVIII